MAPLSRGDRGRRSSGVMKLEVWKCVFNKFHMTGGVDFGSGWIITIIGTLCGGVANENTWGRPGFHFVGSVGT